MPAYRIHRLKDHLRQQFRFAPHVSGTAAVKLRDYPVGDNIEAETPYASFFAMRSSPAPLEVGDLLESPEGTLTIFKFVGFESAQWVLPEPKAPEPKSLDQKQPDERAEAAIQLTH